MSVNSIRQIQGELPTEQRSNAVYSAALLRLQSPQNGSSLAPYGGDPGWSEPETQDNNSQHLSALGDSFGEPAPAKKLPIDISHWSAEKKNAFKVFCKGVTEITQKGLAKGENQDQINQDILNVLNTIAAQDAEAKSPGLQSPLPSGSYRVSQEEAAGGHPGIDLAAPGGTPISAAGTGTVVKSVPNNDGSGYGNYVVIQHADGTQTLYGHMQSAPPVSVGQTVKKGENIGQVGSTGESTGNHLHFEVDKDGQHLNPRDYVQL